MSNFSLLSEAKDFNALEEVVLRLVQAMVVRYVTAYLRFLDKKLMLERPEGLRHVGLRPRTVVTRFGELTIVRCCYLDPESGRYRYLLDERLGLPARDRFTLGLKVQANMLALLTLAGNGWLERAAEVQWGTERLDKPRERSWPQVPAKLPVHLPALDRTQPVSRVLRALTEARRPF
ncbi:MAG: UPF0236 family protein [Firmicutes bacterium]|nr:UPF0236 family protein [Bacillota bacterium]